MTPAEQEADIAAAKEAVLSGVETLVECPGHWRVWKSPEGFATVRRYQADAIKEAVAEVCPGGRINRPGFWTVAKDEAGEITVEIH